MWHATIIATLRVVQGIQLHSRPHFYQTRSAWSTDQWSTDIHSPVDSRAFPSWSLIHGSSWFGLIKSEPAKEWRGTKYAVVSKMALNCAIEDCAKYKKSSHNRSCLSFPNVPKIIFYYACRSCFALMFMQAVCLRFLDYHVEFTISECVLIDWDHGLVLNGRKILLCNSIVLVQTPREICGIKFYESGTFS